VFVWIDFEKDPSKYKKKRGRRTVLIETILTISGLFMVLLVLVLVLLLLVLLLLVLLLLVL